jgi:type IV pilus assembly protein PilW
MKSYSHRTFAFRPRPDQTGFTLVEIMVGLTIGMLATLVVMQVFSVFEVQKRSTTGTADAITNGNIALFKIGRDVQNAGYGLIPISTDLTPLMCPAALVIDPASAVSTHVTGISPIIITDGGAGNSNSDSILIRYGDSLSGGAHSEIWSSDLVSNVFVKSNIGCNLNDITLIMNFGQTQCAVSFVSTPVLPPVGPITDKTQELVVVNSLTPAAATQGSLSCLGRWHEATYSVLGTNLLRQDRAEASGVIAAPNRAIVAGIVNIQAQYGVSQQPSSNQIVAWVDATGAYGAGMTVATRNQIKAVRIAVVARDPTLEPGIVTDPCNPATGAGLCAWVGTLSPAPVINLGADPNWRNYRYRVFETTIPIRSVVRANSTLQP